MSLQEYLGKTSRLANKNNPDYPCNLITAGNLHEIENEINVLENDYRQQIDILNSLKNKQIELIAKKYQQKYTGSIVLYWSQHFQEYLEAKIVHIKYDVVERIYITVVEVLGSIREVTGDHISPVSNLVLYEAGYGALPAPPDETT
jgi:hypothetical protein